MNNVLSYPAMYITSYFSHRHWYDLRYNQLPECFKNIALFYISYPEQNRIDSVTVNEKLMQLQMSSILDKNFSSIDLMTWLSMIMFSTNHVFL